MRDGEGPRKRLTRGLFARCLNWSILFLIFAVWFALTISGAIRPAVLPSPIAVADAAIELWQNGKLQLAITASILRVVVGAGLGIIIGLALGLGAGYAQFAHALLDRPIQMLKAIPFNGLVPLLIVCLGIGEVMKVSLIAIATLVPVYLGTFAGVRSVDRKLVEVATLYEISRREIAFKILFLGALPSILNSVRFALAIAWIALVTSETVNAQSGLGYLMAQAQRFVRTDQVYLCILIYGGLGLATNALVESLERRLLRWQTTFAGR